MAVTDPTRSVTANGNDVATVFPFNPMEIYDSTQLSVYKTDVAGVITLLAEGVSATTYSVSVASYPGTGSITYPASGGTPLATGEVITIIRELPIEQTLVLNNQGGYFPEDVEDALDKLTMIALQLQEQLDRAVLVPAGDDTDPQDLIDDLIAASAAAVAAAALVAGVGLVQATETQIGIAEVATDAEVTTGTSDLQIVTPLKYATGLTNRLASQAQAEAGAVNTNASLMTPLRTAQAIAALASSYPTGHMFGLTLSNNVTDATNDIDISIGNARDGADTASMVLSSALTKRLDANWAVGTNQGGLDTGAKANSTWYHLWLIKRPDTGVVDVLFSVSATAPTMPANYTVKRRLGSVLTDGAGAIRGFVQSGDLFQWKAALVDINTAALGASATAFTVSVPLGFKCHGIFHFDMPSQSSRTVYFQSPNITDAVASTSAAPYGHTGKDTGTQGPNGQVIVETNTSSQIKLSSSAASTTIVVLTDGYWDSRGRAA